MLSGARVVVDDDDGADSAEGFGGGRVAVVGTASKSSYMGFLLGYSWSRCQSRSGHGIILTQVVG